MGLSQCLFGSSCTILSRCDSDGNLYFSWYSCNALPSTLIVYRKEVSVKCFRRSWNDFPGSQNVFTWVPGTYFREFLKRVLVVLSANFQRLLHIAQGFSRSKDLLEYKMSGHESNRSRSSRLTNFRFLVFPRPVFRIAWNRLPSSSRCGCAATISRKPDAEAVSRKRKCQNGL